MEKGQIEIQSTLISTNRDGHNEIVRGESSAFRNGKNPRFYKPFVLRTPSLTVLLAITLLLLALIEYACQKLPDTQNRGIVGTINNRTGLVDELLPRQLEESDTGISTSTEDILNGEITPTPTWSDTPEPLETSLTTQTTLYV